MTESTVLAEKILVPVSNPATVEALIDFAMMLKTIQTKQAIYPLIIAQKQEDLPQKIALYKKEFDKAEAVAAASENNLELLTHIDINIANGIANVTEEKEFTKIVMGWNGEFSATDFIFGSMLKNVLKQTDKMVFVLKTDKPIVHLKRVIVLVPPNAELELGFSEWMEAVKRLSLCTAADLVIYVEENMIAYISEQIVHIQPPLPMHYKKIVYQNWIEIIQQDLNNDDLLIVVSARAGTLSYQKTVTTVTSELAQSFSEKRFAMLFPHQKNAETSPWEV
jgi:K+-sensing histidine kinase KdpD